MRKWAFSLLLILLTCQPADPRSIHGASSTFTPQWQPLQMGGGGQVTGVINSGGTILGRTDVGGGYKRVTSGNCTYGARVYAAPCWQQTATASSLPSFGYADAGDGLIEFVAAPSNPDTMYMLRHGFLYVSIDGGAHWVKTTQTTTQTPNSGNASGKFIAVDPNNPDIVYIDSLSSGVFKTTNGTAGASGGTSTATFSVVASVGTTTMHAIAFNPSNSNNILIYTVGTGAYESTNGSTFSLTTSSPTIVKPQLIADQFNQFWVVDANGTNTNAYRYASSTWNTHALAGNAVVSIAVDPVPSSVGSNHVAVTDYYGQPNITSNNGSTWTGSSSNQTISVGASQPTWMATAAYGPGVNPLLNGYSIAFDNSSNLYFAGGVGVWKLNAPIVANNAVWNADSLGMEELVVNQITTPPGGNALISVWDRGVMRSTNADAFVTSYWNNSSSFNPPITMGWRADYSKADSSFVAVIESWAGNVADAKSTDGGATYTNWASSPVLLSGALGGGWLAVLTSQKYATVYSYPNQRITYTLNGATSWSTSTITGNPTDWLTGIGVGVPLAADGLAADTYCAIRTNKTVYASTDAGANFTATGLTTADIDGAPNLFFLRATPGVANEYFYTAGGQGGSHPQNISMWRISKTTNVCDTATNVNSNLKEVLNFGWGASSGGGAPVLYVYGYFSGTLGFYKSTNCGTPPCTFTAINIPAIETPWPLNSADLVTWLDGDPDIYGRLIVGFRGTSTAYIDTADACPYISFTNIVPNQALTGAAVTLTAAHSGKPVVTGVAFYLDGVQVGATQTGQTTYSVSLNASGQTPGAHTLKVQAAGNGCSLGGTGNSKSIPITTSSLVPANDNAPLRNVA